MFASWRRRRAARGVAVGVAAAVTPLPDEVEESCTHSFAVPSEDLRAIIARQAGPSLRGTASLSELRLRLPAGRLGPLPSDHLDGFASLIDEDDEPALHLQTFNVPTIALDPLHAVRFLIEFGFRLPAFDDRPLSSDDSAHGTEVASGRRTTEVPFEPASSLSFMVELAQFIESLLIEQRYVPSIQQYPGGVVSGVWIPWLDDERAAARLGDMIRSMPPALRAADDDFHHQTWPMLEDFLRRASDALIRDILVRRGFIEAVEGRAESDDPHIPFIASLVSASPERMLGSARAAELFRDVRTWLSRLSRQNGEQPYRLCIRLAEPLADDADLSPEAIEQAQWPLTIHLQLDDGRVIDATDLWTGAAHPGALGGLPVPADQAQEFVLRELSRGRSAFESFDQVLAKSPPSGLTMSTREAHTFLRDTAPVLEESGFAVEVPEWWDSAHGRIGARLFISPADASSDDRERSGSSASTQRRLGLQALVKYEWQISVGDRALTYDEFRRIAASTTPLVRIDGRWVEVRREDVEAARALVEEGTTGEMTVLEAMQRVYRGGRAGSSLNVLGLEASGWIHELLNATGDGVRLQPIPQPPSFHGALRPYQVAGLSWMAYLDSLGLGACLADDMGLGKTVQLIALLIHEREGASAHDTDNGIRPTLVVAPMSVLNNWSREIDRFSGSLRVLVHHGPTRKVGDEFAAEVNRYDVVLTTYGLVNRDLDTLSRVHWGRVVLDEAQYVKNTPTKQAQAIRALRTDRRAALTGTPIENRLSELWSIMDFLNPGFLGSASDFRREFSLPVERHRDPERSDALRRLIRPFVLRRLKTDPDVVPDLPDLVRTKQYAALTREQAALYAEVVDSMLREADAASGIRRRGLVLAGIVKLKQICNHPANLADEGVAPDVDQAGVPLSKRSGKMQTLLPLLDEIMAAGEQSLIFTQYRRMGHLLVRILQHELGVPVLFLHGGTPRPKRQEMIDRFQNPEVRTPIFVLSLRAGGVGLNLTGANHVVHYDRWWNPAVESQATDRAFRIGQTRTVHVHTLICSGTLEDHIDLMLEQKTDLAERIVGSGDAWITELSTGELRDLLALRDSAMEGDS